MVILVFFFLLIENSFLFKKLRLRFKSPPLPLYARCKHGQSPANDAPGGGSLPLRLLRRSKRRSDLTAPSFKPQRSFAAPLSVAAWTDRELLPLPLLPNPARRTYLPVSSHRRLPLHRIRRLAPRGRPRLPRVAFLLYNPRGSDVASVRAAFADYLNVHVSLGVLGTVSPMPILALLSSPASLTVAPASSISTSWSASFSPSAPLTSAAWRRW